MQRDCSGTEHDDQPQRAWLADGVVIADGDSNGRFWFARIGRRIVVMRAGTLVDVYPT